MVHITHYILIILPNWNHIANSITLTLILWRPNDPHTLSKICFHQNKNHKEIVSPPPPQENAKFPKKFRDVNFHRASTIRSKTEGGTRGISRNEVGRGSIEPSRGNKLRSSKFELASWRRCAFTVRESKSIPFPKDRSGNGTRRRFTTELGIVDRETDRGGWSLNFLPRSVRASDAWHLDSLKLFSVRQGVIIFWPRDISRFIRLATAPAGNLLRRKLSLVAWKFSYFKS